MATSSAPSSPSSSFSFLTLPILTTLSLLVISLGYYGQQLLVQQNSCEMTYSSPKLTKVPMSRYNDTDILSSSSFSLYIHGSIHSLNPIPVLFVPGNTGSPMQIRSFASKMHNDGTFQYFALDFGHTRAAIHGSVVLAQAEFLNEALKTIARLYSMKNDPKHPSEYHEVEKIYILAHSIGGIVARTSFLLSNHPSCIVNSIIMLSSPNSKPSYSPDPSLQLLYDQVNMAWRKSFFNQSVTCLPIVEGLWLNSNEDSISHTTARWGQCLPCIPSTRVVSLTGGEIDMQVKSELTHLHIIAPRPQNISAEFPTPVKVRDLVRPKGGWVRYSFKWIYALLWRDSSTNSTESSEVPESCLNDTDEFCFNSTSTTHTPQQTVPQAPRTIYDVTNDQWTSHMVPYVEPQHLSIRTSQIIDIGFQVDHQAILWCKQVLGVTTKLMKGLSQHPLTQQINMSTLVRFRPEYHADLFVNANNLTDKSAVIEPIREFMYRNQSHHVFSRVAGDAERLIFVRQLNSTILALGVIYNTNYLVDILTCYVSIAMLVIATNLVYDLGDKQSHKQSFPENKTYLQALSPENHLFLGSIEDFMLLLIPTKLYQLLNGRRMQIFISLFSVFLGYHFIVARSMNFAELIRHYGPFIRWIVSYGAALFLHIVFYLFMTVWRYTVASIVSILWTLLRYTIWCDLIRKPIRKLLKPIRKLAQEFSTIFSIESLLAIVSMASLGVCLVMIKTRGRQDVSDILLVTTIVYIISFLQLLGVFLTGISWKSISSSALLTPALSLALPVIPLAFPSFFFSLSIVMSALANRQTNLGETFDYFGPDLINSTLAIFFIGYSILYLERFPFEVKPIAFLSEIFDLVHVTRVNYSKNGYFSTKFISDATICLHEDGGIYAVYEQHEQDIHIHSNGNVYEGSYYRVISCNCPKDLSLKSSLEWCEWCRCHDCGGKVIPAHLRSSDDLHETSPRIILMPDVTSELFLLMALLIGVSWGSIYSYHTPYRHLHIVGGVLAAITGVRIAKLFGW